MFWPLIVPFMPMALNSALMAAASGLELLQAAISKLQKTSGSKKSFRAAATEELDKFEISIAVVSVGLD
jgi:hypothetical protein